jgi:hypothetical protein
MDIANITDTRSTVQHVPHGFIAFMAKGSLAVVSAMGRNCANMISKTSAVEYALQNHFVSMTSISKAV